MLLSTYERLILLNILPEEGDLTTLRIVRDLRSGLSFDEDEHAKLNFKTDPTTGCIRWDNAVEPKEIPVGLKAHEIILSAFERLDKAKKLSLDHLAVYERFLGSETAS